MQTMQQYYDLIKRILTEGNIRTDRTNTGTISLFGPQVEFDLAQGFPLDPSRQIFMRGNFEELFWMLRGSTDNNELTDKNVNIWSAWAVREQDLQYTQAERLAILKETLLVAHKGDEEAAQAIYKELVDGAIDIDAMLARHSIPTSKYVKEQLVMLLQKLRYESDSDEEALQKYHTIFKDGATQAELDAVLKKYGIPDAPAIGALGPVYGDQWCNWRDPENDVEVVLTLKQRYQVACDMLDARAETLFTKETLDLAVTGVDLEKDDRESGRYGIVEFVHEQFDKFGIPRTYSKKATINQFVKLINDLKTRPNSRRHIVSAWNVAYLPDESISPQQNVLRGKMALAPCHTLFQYYVEERTINEMMRELSEEDELACKWFLKDNGLFEFKADFRPDPMFYINTKYWEMMFNFEKKKLITDWFKAKGIKTQKLSCKLYQRSCDLLVGGAFNIAAYAAQTMMAAQCVDMVPGRFILTFGDVHIYKDHLLPNADGESVFTQLEREVRPIPKLWINPEVKDIFAFKYEDFKLEGYDPHPAIKYKVAV